MVPDSEEWLRSLAKLQERIGTGARRRLLDLKRSLELQQGHLARNHPGARLREHAQRLDELEKRLELAIRRHLANDKARFEKTRSLLLRASPSTRVAAMSLRLDSARRVLASAARGAMTNARRRLEVAATTLNAVSPLATLERGYAIVTDATGAVLRDSAGLETGQPIRARLAHGRLTATVTATESNEAPNTLKADSNPRAPAPAGEND